MKNNNLPTLIVLLLGLAVLGLAVEPTPKAPPTVDAIAMITKQRDDAQAALAAAQAQQQQTQIAVEYYKTVAERNEALLRLTQLQGELTAKTKALDDLKAEHDKTVAELAALKKPVPPTPETKK